MIILRLREDEFDALAALVCGARVDRSWRWHIEDLIDQLRPERPEEWTARFADRDHSLWDWSPSGKQIMRFLSSNPAEPIREPVTQ